MFEAYLTQWVDMALGPPTALQSTRFIQDESGCGGGLLLPRMCFVGMRAEEGRGLGPATGTS